MAPGPYGRILYPDFIHFSDRLVPIFLAGHDGHLPNTISGDFQNKISFDGRVVTETVRASFGRPSTGMLDKLGSTRELGGLGTGSGGLGSRSARGVSGGLGRARELGGLGTIFGSTREITRELSRDRSNPLVWVEMFGSTREIVREHSGVHLSRVLPNNLPSAPEHLPISSRAFIPHTELGCSAMICILPLV